MYPRCIPYLNVHSIALRHGVFPRSGRILGSSSPSSSSSGKEPSLKNTVSLKCIHNVSVPNKNSVSHSPWIHLIWKTASGNSPPPPPLRGASLFPPSFRLKLHMIGTAGDALEEALSNVALVDFGFAAWCKPDMRSFTDPCGTPEYMAPEVMLCWMRQIKGYGMGCDMWSLGVLTFHVLCNCLPFSGKSNDEVPALHAP